MNFKERVFAFVDKLVDDFPINSVSIEVREAMTDDMVSATDLAEIVVEMQVKLPSSLRKEARLLEDELCPS